MGSVRLYGATSGYLELQAPDVAPDSTLVLPSDSLQPGLVHLHTESFSAVSSVSVDDVFSSTYDNYRIAISASSSGSTTIGLRFRSSGTDTSSGYATERIYGYDANMGAQYISNTQLWLTGNDIANEPALMSIDLANPYLAQHTLASNFATGSNSTTITFVNLTTTRLRNSVSYDGFSINSSPSTITGTLRVYGYRNS